MIGCSTSTTKLTLPIMIDQNGNCVVKIDQQMLPPEAAAKVIMRGAYSKSEIMLQADQKTPYRCIGAAVYVMQRAGAKSVEYRLK